MFKSLLWDEDNQFSPAHCNEQSCTLPGVEPLQLKSSPRFPAGNRRELEPMFLVSQISASSTRTLVMLEVLSARNPIQDFRTPSGLSFIKSARFLLKLSFQWTHFQMETFSWKKSWPALFTVVMQSFLRDLQTLVKKQPPKSKHLSALC